MESALMIAIYYQTKIPISFECRGRLNPNLLLNFFLPNELIRTHKYYVDYNPSFL